MGSKALDGVITPLHIEIALQYFKSRNSKAVAYARRDSDIPTQIRHELADAGLLEMTDDNKQWKATDEMRQYIEALCRVPLPRLSEMHHDMISHLETVLNRKSRRMGDDTVNIHDEKIAAVMDEYMTVTPRTRL